jgi:subtilisin family serine protease
VEQEYVVLTNKSPVPTRGATDGPIFGATGAFDAGLDGVDIETQSLTDEQRADLSRDPATAAISAAMPMTLIEPVDVNDAQPASGSTWGVDAVNATTSPFDGSGITVAVLDTGIDPGHPAFAGVDLIRENFTSEGDDDTHGHGTHCAGTIFGRDVGGQRIGVAPGVDKAIIGKVLGAGGGSSDTVTKAIQWAVNAGAHVVSMSLGIDFPGYVEVLTGNGMPVKPATSLALVEYRRNINLFNTLAQMVEAQGAFTQGTVIVAASGNESERPAYQIAVSPPAAGTGIAAIGALRQGAAGLSVAAFSNTEVDVSAPGVDVVSAAVGGGLQSMSGTSMATPHVAGVVALWAQRMLDASGFTNGQAVMAQVIGNAATAPLADGFDTGDVGNGIVQAPTA